TLSPVVLVVLVPPPRFTLFPYTTLFRSPRFGPRYHNWQIHSIECAERQFTRVNLPGVVTGPLWRLCRQNRTARARTVTRLALTRSEEHTSELQSLRHLVCRLLLEKKKSQ